MWKRCQLINVDVDVTKSRQTELYLGCLPFKQNSGNFGWEFSFGKNDPKTDTPF